ncbi:MAG TPA: hypothetical protein PLQ19_05450 [Aeromicrobium sp.]|nr:hypothetical protein [Aeromicrobium sp.]
MNKLVQRTIKLAILPLIVALSLSACGKSGDNPGTDETPTPVATPTPFKGLPEGATPPQNVVSGVIAGNDDREVFVVTFGSSTNPAVVNQVTAEGQKVTVQVSAIDGKIATMDFVPTTSTIYLPKSVDTSKAVEFDLGDFGSLTLDSLKPGTAAWYAPKQ